MTVDRQPILYQPSKESQRDKVHIGRDRHRYGWKVIMRCNQPKCDARKRVYFEAEPVAESNVYYPEEASKEFLYQHFRNEFPLPYQSTCNRCGGDFMTEARLSRIPEKDYIAVTCPAFCSCSQASTHRGNGKILVKEVARIFGENEFKWLE